MTEEIKDNTALQNRIDDKWKIIRSLESKAELTNNSQPFGSRSELSGYMGKSYGGRRDLYQILGYNKTPTFNDFFTRFKTQDIANAIVNAPVKASWRLYPTITENLKGEETQFEKETAALFERKSIYHYMSRADRLSGIGQYAVLLLGFNDGLALDQEVVTGKELLYVQPYKESSAVIQSYITETSDENYGKPLIYKISTANPGQNTNTSIDVHYSRVIHVSEGQLESDTFGNSRLEPVLNRLHDLDLVLGGSAEMFWRGAFPGVGLQAKEGAHFSQDGQSLEALETEMDAYIHNMQRYFRVQDIDIQQMTVQVADPTAHVDVQLTAISSQTGIPKRIFTGSERGELASSQDEINWNVKIDERRTNFLSPMVVRPFIDKLILTGVLPKPKDRYSIEWPTLFEPSDDKQAETAKIKSDALSTYAKALGADTIVPPEMFLRDILGWTEEKIQQANEIVGKLVKEDTEDVEDEE
jgi:hypothetical protein